MADDVPFLAYSTSPEIRKLREKLVGLNPNRARSGDTSDATTLAPWQEQPSGKSSFDLALAIEAALWIAQRLRRSAAGKQPVQPAPRARRKRGGFVRSVLVAASVLAVAYTVGRAAWHAGGRSLQDLNAATASKPRTAGRRRVSVS
jgi:hypothetical protein